MQDSPSRRRRRSVLYVPASNEKALTKLPMLDADVDMIDLEDVVAPSEKANSLSRPTWKRWRRLTRSSQPSPSRANRDKGTIRIDGRMVERLHFAQAERLLAKAGR